MRKTIMILLACQLTLARDLTTMTNEELLKYRDAIKECEQHPDDPCIAMLDTDANGNYVVPANLVRNAIAKRIAREPSSMPMVTVNNNLPQAPTPVVEHNSNWLLWTVVGLVAGGAGTYFYMREK